MGWPASLPRLKSLYQASDINSPDNYFSALVSPNGVRIQEKYKPLEDRLSRLDETAFEALAKKAGPLVSRKNKHGEWRSLFDALDEVYGYIHLLDSGYEQIEFIPTDIKKTPDLFGSGPKGSAILEVKCIRRSDIDRANSGELTIGVPGLPPGFKNKLNSTYQEACEQLSNYKPGSKEMRRVCCFVIDVDLSCVLHRGNREILENYLKELATDGIEIFAFSRHW